MESMSATLILSHSCQARLLLTHAHLVLQLDQRIWTGGIEAALPQYTADEPPQALMCQLSVHHVDRPRLQEFLMLVYSQTANARLLKRFVERRMIEEVVAPAQSRLASRSASCHIWAV